MHTTGVTHGVAWQSDREKRTLMDHDITSRQSKCNFPRSDGSIAMNESIYAGHRESAYVVGGLFGVCIDFYYLFLDCLRGD
ncbi:hypothetical protein BDN72DRAFT_445194 [Pluteus cervinus]|uniref:Uncharacterized protein n=1 Tax=Pluteus cervinus TaxID=181527 RepID=A0ACD3BC08_9AGAR|nr:hypothetical protein BDN72DRAFT_445194 [Pluteus cervinus]